MTQHIFETLHIINKSLTDRHLYQNCIEAAQEADAILLIESGVYSILDNDFSMLSALNIPIYALQVDLTARGLESKIKTSIDEKPRVTIINDNAFVDLCCQYKRTISWF